MIKHLRSAADLDADTAPGGAPVNEVVIEGRS